jgi:hypothetical protein
MPGLSGNNNLLKLKRFFRNWHLVQKEKWNHFSHKSAIVATKKWNIFLRLIIFQTPMPNEGTTEDENRHPPSEAVS